MPLIIPIRNLVVMNSKLSDQFIKPNRIDQIIYESEKEMNEGAKPIDLDDAFRMLNNIMTNFIML